MPAHRKSFRGRTAGLILAVLVIILAPQAAQAQCTVTDNSDDATDSGSLRYCVAQANVAASPYIITFASSLNGQKITLIAGNGPLEISNTSAAVTIQGPGAKLLTISGSPATYDDVIVVSFSASLNISGLTITNVNGMGGVGGTGIQNAGTLAVSNCIITGNPGGGIASESGTITVNNSTVSDNAGGIWVDDSTLIMSNSTISGNTAGFGAGIYAGNSTLNVSNSTISGNNVDFGGGGIYIESATTLTLSNSTISGNTAGFETYVGYAAAICICDDSSAATINSSTISGNSAANAIENSGPLTINNSIIAGNTSTLNGDDCDGCGTQSTYNLISTTATSVSPMLAPLVNYGGPTQTMLPMPGVPPGAGSPAICAGSPSLVPAGLTTDQRGFPRLNTSYTNYSTGSPCVDLGAVQTNYQSVQFPTPDAAYTGTAGVAVSEPAYPVLSVIENGQNIGGVPVTLAINGSPSVGGVWTGTTVSNTGAAFDDLIVNSGGNYTLSSALNITPSVSISTAISTNGNATLAITASPTNTAITGHTPNPSVVGQGVTVTFTVAPVSTSAITPTGTVTVTDSAGDSCTAPASATPVSCTLAITTAGSKTLTATYSGDSNFAGSSGTAPQTQTVNPAMTNITITGLTPNPSVAGQQVSINFKVAPVAPGAGTPTEDVTVTDPAGDSCTAPVAAGKCSIAFSSAGSKVLTAMYAGDGNYRSSSSATARQNVWDFVISAKPKVESAGAGATALYLVTVTPQGGFTGTISLSCTQAPPNSVCTVLPNHVVFDGTRSMSALALITPHLKTPRGTYTPQITGTYGSGHPSTGGLTHSATVNLKVL